MIDKSQEQRTRILEHIAKNVHVWRIKVTKIKAIFFTINMFSNAGKHFVAEGWYPIDQHEQLHKALKKASVSSKLLLFPIFNMDKSWHFAGTDNLLLQFNVLFVLLYMLFFS